MSSWRDELDRKIRELLNERLGIEDGYMMVALKPIEVDALAADIRDLVLESVREASR